MDKVIPGSRCAQKQKLSMLGLQDKLANLRFKNYNAKF